MKIGRYVKDVLLVITVTLLSQLFTSVIFRWKISKIFYEEQQKEIQSLTMVVLKHQILGDGEKCKSVKTGICGCLEFCIAKGFCR